MSDHLCHAEGCETPVPPRLFMCRRHWSALPSPLQELIWHYYKPGQERRGGVTWEYLYASQRVVEWLADRDGVEVGLRMSEGFEGSASDECVAHVAEVLAAVPS